jgi:hypothetical protein
MRPKVPGIRGMGMMVSQERGSASKHLKIDVKTRGEWVHLSKIGLFV